jgi:hypothetical protein
MRRFGHSLAPLASVNTIDEMLIHSDGDVQNGEMVWVRSVASMFSYQLNSGLTPDGVNVVASAFGPGLWIRQTGSSDSAFLQQDTWFINPVTGNDQNTGLTSATALKTWAELRRRLAGGPIQVACNIVIAGNLPGTDPMIVDFGSEALLVIQGLLTVALSSHIGTFTARSPATNALGLLHDGAQVWAPFVNPADRIFMTGGVATGSQALVISDQGGGTARVSTFVDVSGAEHTPGNGDAYIVASVPVVDTLVLDEKLTTTSPLIFQNLYFSPNGGLSVMPLAGTGGVDGALFFGCTFGSSLPAAFTSVAATLVNCRYAGLSAVGCRVKIYGGASFPGLAPAPMDFSDGGASELFAGFVAEQTGIVVERSAFVNFDDAAVEDFPATYGLIVRTFGRAYANKLWGVSAVGATVGCLLDVTGRMEGSTANNRTLAGAANALKIGNAAAGVWPAVLATKTVDASSLAAFMHD